MAMSFADIVLEGAALTQALRDVAEFLKKEQQEQQEQERMKELHELQQQQQQELQKKHHEWHELQKQQEQELQKQQQQELQREQHPANVWLSNLSQGLNSHPMPPTEQAINKRVGLLFNTEVQCRYGYWAAIQ
jgi:FKBP-type peptidyl-prolyl cis-trans isomerase